MFGFGKSNGKKSRDKENVGATVAPAAEFSLFDDGRDKYFGLENFGSTCYANSVIQALFYTSVFRKALISAPFAGSPNATSNEKAAEVDNVLDSIISEQYSQRSFTDVNTPVPTSSKKKKGLASWSTEEEEKDEFRRRAFYPKGELPMPHPMFPDPPANKNDPSFRGQEMKPTDDTATDLFKKKLLEEHLVVSPAPRSDKDAVLFHSLRDLYSLLLEQKQRTGILSPRSFMETLRSENEMFRQNIHHDAHEFLNYILNSVHDGYAHLTNKNSLRDNTFVHNIFEGTLASEVRCLTCENVTSRDESFLDLSLDIEENTSVSSCMRAFSASEFLREKNKFFCEKCNGLQEAERRMKIRKLPQILALHLKRFKFEQEIQRHVKLQHVVRYETTLRLGNTTDDATDPDRLYELYAVVVHLGGASYHGHYIACVRTDHLGWVLYDDEHVERIPESVVMRFIGGEDSGTACAYVLFYRTVDIEEPLESRASLMLPSGSTHATQMPPEIRAANANAISATISGQSHSPSTMSTTSILPRERDPALDQHQPGENVSANNQNSISPPQAAYMKKAGLTRTSTQNSTASSSNKPTARRMLSNVFSNSNHTSPVAVPAADTPPEKVVSPSSASPTFTNSVPKSMGRSSTMSNLPSFVAEKREHHGPYTGTTVTSTPLEEHDEPDWSAAIPSTQTAKARPQRPGLGEKKSTGLGRFSSFRGKRGSFFGGKKDEGTAELEHVTSASATEKLKRRTSVFGSMGK